MADDPRQEPMAQQMRLALLASGGVTLAQVQEHAPGLATDALAAVDRADPLRALLADEDRAKAMFVRILSEWETFTAGDGQKSIGMKEPRTSRQVAEELLAALREVAGL